MQGRIVELIGRINHDEITAELLRLNDELNNLFLRHQRYEKNRDPQNVGIATPASILGAAMGVPLLDQGKYFLIFQIKYKIFHFHIFSGQAKRFTD